MRRLVRAANAAVAAFAFTAIMLSGLPAARAAAIGGPFQLVDHTGQTVTEESFDDRYLLVYFGYAYCPDVCPTELLIMGQAIDALGALGDEVQPLFITVDPARDINAIVEEAAALALIGASDRDITLSFSLEDALPAVLIDRIQVQQVVLNILRNAIEAFEGPGERKVLVATAAGGPREILVRIRDNGPGLAPSVADDPFRPFQTTKEDGLGIGLAISRSIIDAHGGRLWAENAPDGGAVFRFTLPVGVQSDA